MTSSEIFQPAGAANGEPDRVDTAWAALDAAFSEFGQAIDSERAVGPRRRELAKQALQQSYDYAHITLGHLEIPALYEPDPPGNET